MFTAEALEALYKLNLNWIPDGIYKGIGQFNVFKTKLSDTRTPVSPKDYYRITLIIGNCQVFTANEVFPIDKQALLFSNPQGLYTIKYLKNPIFIYYSLFSNHFLDNSGSKTFSEFFRSSDVKVFNLQDIQVNVVTGLYESMLKEISTEYIYKYDAVRVHVSDLLHLGMKLSGL